MAEHYPRIQQAMYKFYGADCFSRWGAELRDNMSKAASNLMPAKRVAVPYLPGNSLIPVARPEVQEKHSNLRMYVAEQVIIEQAPELDDADREKLLKDTVLIKDDREGDAVSTAYNTQIEAILTNPSETSLYRVLERPGKFTKMLIAMRIQQSWQGVYGHSCQAR